MGALNTAGRVVWVLLLPSLLNTDTKGRDVAYKQETGHNLHISGRYQTRQAMLSILPSYLTGERLFCED